jgi:hypothetical protein
LKKNLPVKHAHFMVEKANKRKRNEGKDTVFSYGGQVWSQERIQSRAGRAKKSREAIDVDGQ